MLGRISLISGKARMVEHRDPGLIKFDPNTNSNGF